MLKYYVLFCFLMPAVIVRVTRGYGEAEMVRFFSGLWISPTTAKYIVWLTVFLTAYFGIAIPITFIASLILLRLGIGLYDYK